MKKNDIMKKNRVAAAIAAVALVGCSLLTALPAHASETWTKNINCKLNNWCSISSTTTGGLVVHSYDGFTQGSWPTGGYRSSAKPASIGWREAKVATAGTLQTHNAHCYCPSGVSCGS